MFTLRFLSLDSAGLLDHYLRTDFLDINFLDNFRWTLFDFFVRISIKNYQFIREWARWWLCLNFSLKIVPFYCDWLMLIAFVCPKSRIKMPFSHSVRFLKLFNCSQSMECWKCGLIALYTIIYTTAYCRVLLCAAENKTRFCSGFISQDIFKGSPRARPNQTQTY